MNNVQILYINYVQILFMIYAQILLSNDVQMVFMNNVQILFMVYVQTHRLITASFSSFLVALPPLQDAKPAPFRHAQMPLAARITGLACALNVRQRGGSGGGDDKTSLLRGALCHFLVSVARKAVEAGAPEPALKALRSLSQHCGDGAAIDELTSLKSEGRLLEVGFLLFSRAVRSEDGREDD